MRNCFKLRGLGSLLFFAIKEDEAQFIATEGTYEKIWGSINDAIKPNIISVKVSEYSHIWSLTSIGLFLITIGIFALVPYSVAGDIVKIAPIAEATFNVEANIKEPEKVVEVETIDNFQEPVKENVGPYLPEEEVPIEEYITITETKEVLIEVIGGNCQEAIDE